MYYNCGIAMAKRQTKLKLHFIIQCVCSHKNWDYGFPWLFLLSLTTLQFLTFPGFPDEWSPYQQRVFLDHFVPLKTKKLELSN